MKKLARMEAQSTLRNEVTRASCACPAMSKPRRSPSFRPSAWAMPSSTLTPSASSACQRPATKGLWSGKTALCERLISRSRKRLPRSASKSSGPTARPLMATSRPRIMGNQSGDCTPALSRCAKKSLACSGCTLMTKRSGAFTGVAWRQLAIRSVRSKTSKASASKPTAKALTCTTANTGRAATCRVARRNQRGADSSGTIRRSKNKAAAARAANTKSATPKPPTVIRPSVRLRLTMSKVSAKPSKPISSTRPERTCTLPRSRRITRSGGTLASCNTGGRPKATSSVKPMARPISAGCSVAPGKLASTSPASNCTNPRCTP